MKVETGMMKAGAEAQRIREGVRGGVRLSELRTRCPALGPASSMRRDSGGAQMRLFEETQLARLG